MKPHSAQSTQRSTRIAGVLSRPAFRREYRGAPSPSAGSGCTLHAKKSHPPRGIPLEAGPVGIMGEMPMPRQATTDSFSSFSQRLSDFALPFSSLFLSIAKAGYPPEIEAIRIMTFFAGQLLPREVFFLIMQFPHFFSQKRDLHICHLQFLPRYQ